MSLSKTEPLQIRVDCVFVGAGAVATEYAADLSGSQVALAGVCDLQSERAERLAARHDAEAFTNLSEALSTLDAPLVVNLTGHAAHAPVTRQCLEDGRHVYSEKPLALDAETAADLLALARRRRRGLGCAPSNASCPPQRRVGRVLADGRPGPVRLGYAHAHVGRIPEWHDRPDSFLQVGPLYDGAVYPLSLLVALLGPVERIRTADALDPWPARQETDPDAPTHVEATLSFGDAVVRLTASFYAPHRSREFYGVELHGDDGSLYLQDAGARAGADGDVSFGRSGHEYTHVPAQHPTVDRFYSDSVAAFAAAAADGRAPLASARRGAHVVAVCNAVEQAASDGGPVPVPAYGATADPVAAPVVSPRATREARDDTGARSVRLPPVGFGCSRYRGGEYVDRAESVVTALDAGYRLLDSAELYGNEHRLGEALAAPGAPDRKRVFLLGKVWNTNHGHVAEACVGSLAELGVDAFDCYTLHWPEAWAYQGPLCRLAEKPVPEQEALTFPETDSGERATADVSLTEAWANLEAVHERGLARTLGLCNASRSQLRQVLETGTVAPALVQVERHPYQPREELVEFCHQRGIRVVAHSPLSAPGLLDEPVLAEIAAERGLSPAAVVVAWNVTEGVVPIPSSTTEQHLVSNLRAASVRLTEAERARIATLADPEFER
jgi:diketogulonate reductase-like aldo/keto reductase/predicted dehydrogenase